MLSRSRPLYLPAAAADVVCSGADKLAVMDGPLYPHQGGLAFISRPSKVHVLLLQQVCVAACCVHAGRHLLESEFAWSVVLVVQSCCIDCVEVHCCRSLLLGRLLWRSKDAFQAALATSCSTDDPLPAAATNTVM